ncbi:nicotinamidase [Ascoidea rubescens DSM 1968]|uniref:nicotinamidase n=1 Tax=Ascoidea rubescens DSM 1968 TaxID=1344418 RepID=A0A1D2VNI6_9ASCO|nr:Isochorismatase hydrolase [Ascoidea rubescens DSM 1968]ODV63137.1 Isochorismatase hydrolase [Ascoidea rubescens DSM 1968]
MTISRALVIIDLQEDFLPPNGSLAVKDGREIIGDVNELINLDKYKWKLVIASKDWHPKDHCSFASNNNVKEFSLVEFSQPGTKGAIKAKQVVWPDHCIQNEKGSEFGYEFREKFERLKEKYGNGRVKVVEKGYLKDREYYSCFNDVWNSHHTEMEAILDENEITDVYFVGIAYDYCVLHSSISCARLKKFHTYVLKDVCKSVAPENDKATDEKYLAHGVKIIGMRSEEVARIRDQLGTR